MTQIVRVVRNVDFTILFDAFFISAISTILITRFYLQITGYPQIGGSTLHISHLLPGSLLMLAAILLMLAAVNRAVREFSAVISGIGFGLVWDELGKFITNDNNYFFKPTLGLIYVTFIALYLLVRYIGSKRLTSDDYLANALDLLKEGAVKELDYREYNYAKELMTHVSTKHALYEPTMALLRKVQPSKNHEPLFIDKVTTRFKSPLMWLSKWKYFKYLIFAVSFLYGLTSIVVAALFFLGILDGDPSIEESDIIGGLATLVTTAYITAGCFYFVKSQKFRAYGLFETALLVQIFVGQVVLFFKNAGLAVVGLLITLFLLLNVRILIAEEYQARIKTK